MSRESSGPYLSAVFVDYDNIYLSLKRKSDEAAKNFAKNAYRWVKAIESGRLITSTNAPAGSVERRLVMNRCYGNPVPRRNQSDNSTDMNSFPFVRHHFLRSGFEIVDCPPLTAQLKNSADIRMVMDVRDYLTHETYFNEFIILSGDADFTPVLHRLRAHARRTVIFANDHTATPYKALSDGEIREQDLIDLLLESIETEADVPKLEPGADQQITRNQIVAEVVKGVMESNAPQPLEALAERAIRILGHEKTVGSGWGGAGNFRDLLLRELPAGVKLTEQAPYFAYDVSRAISRQEPPQLEAKPVPEKAPAPPAAEPDEAAPATGLSPQRASSLQDSIARIHQACKAPPLSPPEYRAVFTMLATEITNNKMQGVQTVQNMVANCQELGIDAKSDDIRFIIDVVGKQDPWFERGASAIVFASRFRNFVIGQCQAAGMSLSSDEIDLIDAWFAGGGNDEAASRAVAEEPAVAGAPGGQAPLQEKTEKWWEETAGGKAGDMALSGANDTSDDFPRIVRNRLRG